MAELLGVSTDLGNIVCRSYAENGTVGPFNLFNYLPQQL